MCIWYKHMVGFEFWIRKNKSIFCKTFLGYSFYTQLLFQMITKNTKEWFCFSTLSTKIYSNTWDGEILLSQLFSFGPAVLSFWVYGSSCANADVNGCHTFFLAFFLLILGLLMDIWEMDGPLLFLEYVILFPSIRCSVHLQGILN